MLRSYKPFVLWRNVATERCVTQQTVWLVRTLAYLNGIWICSTPDRAYTSARSGPHVGQIGPASPDRRCLQITKLLRDLNLLNAWIVDSFYPCTGDLLHPGDWIRTTRELSTRYTLVRKTCFCPSDLNYFNPWSVAFTQAVRPAERSLERECREKCTEDVRCHCDLNHYNRLVDAFYTDTGEVFYPRNLSWFNPRFVDPFYTCPWVLL